MKKGFTLAEILVSMGIIGIISAMTIPSLVSEHKKQVYASQLSSTVSNLENAFSSMISAEGVSTLDETEFYKRTLQSANGYAVFSKYYKFASQTTTGQYYGQNQPYRKIGSADYLNPPSNILYITKNGMILSINTEVKQISKSDANTYNVPEICSNFMLSIDVNGKGSPNEIGRDVFYFLVGDDAILYPYGSRIASLLLYGDVDSVYTKIDGKFPCTENKYSLGCTARVVENGYKMDY